MLSNIVVNNYESFTYFVHNYKKICSMAKYDIDVIC